MIYSNNKIKCLRKNFSKIPKILDVPYLLSIQIDSYDNFLYRKKNKFSGLDLCFNSIFPIYNYNNNIKLVYLNYKIKKPLFNDKECLIRGLTYFIKLKVKLALYIYNKNKNKLLYKKKQYIYFGDIPLMTNRGTFVVNGTERVVVSQLHRSPGVFFNSDRSKFNTSGKILYNARIIPYRGSWLDFEFDSKDILYMRIDRKRKLPATIILKSLGYSNSKILNLFFDFIKIKFINDKIFMNFIPIKWKNKILNFDIIFNNIKYLSKGKKINSKCIKKMQLDKINYILIPNKYLIGKILAKKYKFILDNKKYVLNSNIKIDNDILNNLINSNCNSIKILSNESVIYNSYILNTLLIDNSYDKKSALIEIYRVIRPGEPPSKESCKKVFNNLFFSLNKYNLSSVGRMKLNISLGLNNKNNIMVLTSKDIISVIKKLIDIKNGIKKIDDIDSLSNRRVRCVGEMIENQFRIGLLRIEKIIKDRFSVDNFINIFPKDIINAKILSLIIRDFFCSSQLSQFMDQNNPLSEITHKRRISALGPGGLTRERAGFEVRDIHSTHYGRVCPIETPEGPNIGLINSLSIYAKINKYGFIETPYRKIKNGFLTNKIDYLSAIKENNNVIAPANTIIDKFNKIKDSYILCRYKGEFSLFYSNKIDYIDASPQQIVSVGTSLIPFLEHDDANRALMGANMQRQAVPCLISDRPLVGTGMERIVANDSGVCVISKSDGFVKYVDSSKIIVENKNNIDYLLDNIYIYDLFKYLRSNQNTCINQRPCVNLGDKIKKGDILADGFSTHLGELSLGQNVRVAFMSWYGYNFEDSILISENIIHKDIFTTLHIQELSCICRDTKLGMEEITSDIPNINDYSLSKLDESGIINIGSEVSVGDILVGKITPKGETQLSPEEKLLRAIFGEKASEVKDSSLRVPNGCAGKIIDVQIFSREGISKDKRSLNIEKLKLDSIKNKINIELLYFKKSLIKYINNILYNFNIVYNINININDIYNLNIKDLDIKKKIFKLIDSYKKLENILNKKLDQYINKIIKFNELTPGILKIVKVYIAIRRQLQVGDKMSGRHGNKGVVSKICPIEDMPYDENGIPIDVILNPLSIPSRMNVGQVLETHLGMALKTIGSNINDMLNNNYDINKIKSYIKKIFLLNSNNEINFDLLNDDKFIFLAKSLINGISVSTPVFDGIKEYEIKELLKIAKLPTSGQIYLYDGLTGKKFERPVTVGYMYIMKLNHLVEDKIHARSTGSYSLITQQPLGGKSQFGGQRFGEMEVWALEAYGAAYTLQEMLTVKSDDVYGRTRIYKNIIKGNYQMEPDMPESFNVLIKEICSLGINIELKSNY